MSEMVKLSATELEALRQQIKQTGSVPAYGKPATESDTAPKGAEAASLKCITVDITEDKMFASVTLADPGDEIYTVAEIVGKLRDSKVITGVKSSIIMKMLEDKQYDTPVIVAKGNQVIPSTQGYYEFFFDTNQKKSPLIREDGTADYSSVGSLENVEAGQLIALYHPAVQGRSGFNVLGMEMIARIAKELPILRGQNIERDDATGEYRAKISGKISLKEYNIEILDVHEINGDVTLIQGKIDFYGDLYINGDIENGVVIRVGRNVVINGTVGAATIFAGGDIVLSKGIQGSGRGHVSARGNVYSDFIEYAKVEAGLDVYANSIINSEVTTSGNIVVSGKHGSIIGGNTHSLLGITANAAGNPSEIKTILHAGFPEEYYREFSQLANTEKKHNDDLGKVVDEIMVMLGVKQKTGSLTRDQKLNIVRLKERKETICSELEAVKKKMQEISHSMSRSVNASITIKGSIFRNVIIGIDAAKLSILSEESYVRYVCKNNEIERRTIQEDDK